MTDFFQGLADLFDSGSVSGRVREVRDATFKGGIILQCSFSFVCERACLLLRNVAWGEAGLVGKLLGTGTDGDAEV